jgi:hypothetical protein
MENAPHTYYKPLGIEILWDVCLGIETLKSDDQDNKCIEKHPKIVLYFIWPPNRNKYNSRIFGNYIYYFFA